MHFLIFYEFDQQTVKTVLRLDDYDSEWVLLATWQASTPQSQQSRARAKARARTRTRAPRTWTRTCREGDQWALASSHGLFS